MDDDVDTWDDDSPPVVLPCPNCGVEVYEEAEQCPSCGEWIVAATGALAGRPTWWIVLGVAGIVATLAWLSGLFG